MIEQRTPEVHREHFVECFVHFASWLVSNIPMGKQNAIRVRQSIADFCGVEHNTVRLWLNDPERRMPCGEAEIKLKCFLDLNGYRIIEFERLPRSIRNFAELIGFGILSVEDARNLLGYTRANILYPILRQEGRDKDITLSKEKETRMFEIWKEKKDELEARKREAFKSFRLEISSHKDEQQLLTLLKSTGSLVSRQIAVLGIMRGVLGLLDEGLFSDLSPTEIAGFNNTDRLTVLQLSNHFTALSSKLIQIKEV